MRKAADRALSSSSEVKMKDVISQLRESTRATSYSLRDWLRNMNEWYDETYYRKGKVDPLIHYMLLCFGVGYTINYSHIRHKVKNKNADLENL
eukprot:jgi/Galph1/4697/GphlegSOOS_G3326.1